MRMHTHTHTHKHKNTHTRTHAHTSVMRFVRYCWATSSRRWESCLLRVIAAETLRHDAPALPPKAVAFCHDSSICVTWLIHTYEITHSYVWHDSFMYVYMCDKNLTQSCLQHWHYVMIPSHCRQQQWRSARNDMTHSYVWHDSFVCVTWLIHVYIRATWTWLNHTCAIDTTSWCPRVAASSSGVLPKLIHTSGMTHSYVWHDSFTYMYIRHESDFVICATLTIYHDALALPPVAVAFYHKSFICVTWIIHMCEISSGVLQHMYIWQTQTMARMIWIELTGVNIYKYIYICI